MSPPVELSVKIGDKEPQKVTAPDGDRVAALETPIGLAFAESRTKAINEGFFGHRQVGIAHRLDTMFPGDEGWRATADYDFGLTRRIGEGLPERVTHYRTLVDGQETDLEIRARYIKQLETVVKESGD